MHFGEMDPKRSGDAQAQLEIGRLIVAVALSVAHQAPHLMALGPQAGSDALAALTFSENLSQCFQAAHRNIVLNLPKVFEATSAICSGF